MSGTVRVGRLLAVAGVLLLPACGGGNSGSSASSPSINASATVPKVSTVTPGKLTACMDMPYEPFAFVENGKQVGIDVDLVRAIAGELGLETSVADVVFDDIFIEMEKGTCDLVASALSITDERRQKYLFTRGYFEVNQTLLVRAEDAGSIGDLQSVKGRIGVLSGTTNADYVAKHVPKERVLEYAEAPQMREALRRKEIDAVVQDGPVNGFWARGGEFRMVHVFDDVAREEYGMALPQRSTELRDAVDAALGRVRDDGRYDEILRRYLAG